LPNAQRGLIEASKPYQGGNQMLWTLHRLDIKRRRTSHGISGAKGRDKRLAFDNLIKDARDASKS
jgi:hypothetical protein